MVGSIGSLRRFVRCPLLLLFLVTASGGAAGAAVLEVPSVYPNIQAGIHAADTGDTVRVAAGKFSGEGNSRITFGGKDLYILGAGSDQTVIVYSGRTGMTVDGSASAVLEDVGFSGFRSSPVDFAWALNVDSATLEMKRCAFRDNTLFQPGSALRVSNHSVVTAVDSDFWDNDGYDYPSGSPARATVFVDPTSTAAFTDCRFAGGMGTAVLVHGEASLDRCFLVENGGSIASVDGSGTLRMTRSTVANNGSGHSHRPSITTETKDAEIRIERSVLWNNRPTPLDLMGGGKIQIDCSIVGDVGGVDLEDYGEGNLGAAPRFAGMLGTSVAVETTPDNCEVLYGLCDPVSPALAKNSPCGETIGASSATVPFLDSSPIEVPTTHPTLRLALESAMESAPDGSRTIRVISAPPVSGVEGLPTIRRDIAVVGVGGEPPLITGTPESAALTSVQASLHLEHVGLHGFAHAVHATDGETTLLGCSIENTGDAAVQIEGGSLEMSACRLLSNGGGIHVEGAVANIEDLELSGTTRLPTFLSKGAKGSLHVSNSTVHDNQADGVVGFLLEGGQHNFESVSFRSNRSRSGVDGGNFGSGSIGIATNCGLTMRGCEVREPSAENGHLVIRDSEVDIDGCLIAGASGLEPVLVVVGESDVRVSNSTIADNSTVNSTVLASGGSSVSLDRSIVWSNCGSPGKSAVQVQEHSLLEVRCSALDIHEVQNEGGDLTTEDLVSSDPRFVAPGTCGEFTASSGDYNLLPCSPCAPQRSPCGELIGFGAPAAADSVDCSDPNDPDDPNDPEDPNDSPELDEQVDRIVFLSSMPARGELQFRAPTDLGDHVQAMVVDAKGRVIETRELRSTPDGMQIIGLSLPGGVYHLRLRGDIGVSRTAKFVWLGNR